MSVQNIVSNKRQSKTKTEEPAPPKPAPPVLSEIEKNVFEIIGETLAVAPEEITHNAYLVEDLGADSLDAMEIVLICEDSFEIEIGDEDANAVRQVKDVCALVEARTVKVRLAA